MKVIKKNIYYCDYCPKRYLREHLMIKHEKRCTANINRECNFCKDISNENNIPSIIKKFKKRYEIQQEYFSDTSDILYMKIVWPGKIITIDEIKKLVQDCPNCVLTIIRQLQKDTLSFNYDYKQQCQEWIDEYWNVTESEYHNY